MKKIFLLILCVIMIHGQMSVHANMNISAQSAIVTDMNGTVIYEKNARSKMPMASTTKIMTALCVIENINIAMPVIIDKRSCGVEGSSVYLKEGEMMTALELLYAMMLNSGNDAATALAIAVCGSVEDFAVLMTSVARNIGAMNTNFTNPSGLYEDDHYTTAYDLALISSYAMKNKIFAQIVSTKNLNISGAVAGEVRYLSNHNKLLRTYEGCIGVKTGYTKKCGRCLVSAASRNNKSFVCVTLNAPNDWNDHKNLLDLAFSEYKQ